MLPYGAIRPFLHLFTPERAHGLAISALKMGLAGSSNEKDDPLLATTVWGLQFPNPVGLAAGFDKDAEVMDAMLGQGFGFVEAGSVTPKPQPGNPKPRLFRLESKGPGSFVHTISAKYAAGLRQDGCDCGVACAHTTK